MYVVAMSGSESGYDFCNPLVYSFCVELRVFPEKFIVCVSKLDFDPSAWTCDNGVLVSTKLFYKFGVFFNSNEMNVYIYRCSYSSICYCHLGSRKSH